MIDLKEVAEYIDLAAANASSVQQLQGKFPISLSDAYKVQELSIGRRLTRGEKLIGYKMGFTSKAKMEQMGVHDLIWGRLTDSMHVADDGFITLDKFIHPRAEPEIAFRIKEDIKEEVALSEIQSIVDGLAPAIEVIDSRYENFKFSLEDVVADNCSSSAFVIGDWLSPDTEIKNLDIQLSVDSEVVHAGNSNAILDNPWQSLQEATRLITAYGDTIKAGQIILAGAATPAIYLKACNRVTVNVSGFKTISLNVE